jgi:hypothetical protein
MMKSKRLRTTLVLILLMVGIGAPLSAQSKSGSISGVVTDPSGGLMINVEVVILGPNGLSRTSMTDSQGRFLLSDLPPGEYRLRINAPGFSLYDAKGLKLIAGETLTQDAKLTLALVVSEVSVLDSKPMDLEPTSNANATILRGSDLNSLSDDPDELASDLQALAGPAAGPNGGEIFVDGFSGGKLPSKASIREIRVNQNPFSAEYDRLGYGRIEVFTKPGSDKLSGQAMFNFGDSLFNSRNPFSLDKPDYQRRNIEGSISGPLGKNSSFSLEAERRDMGEVSVINALVLDSSFKMVPLQQSVMSPNTNTEFELRIDHQLGARHTLVGRFDWEDTSRENSGLDTYSLPSRSSNSSGRESQVQITETAVLSPTTVHEVRIQYSRNNDTSEFLSTNTAISVPEAFTTGGSAGGPSSDQEDRWELNDALSLASSKHMVKLGGRLRRTSQVDRSMQGYNGLFLFTSMDAYRITEEGLRNGLTAEQIRAQGGGASQFSITAGDPSASVSQIDAGLFFQEDWRIARQFTFSAGVRYETQSNIGDRHEFAPRVGFAWAPKLRTQDQPLAVIRGGFGIFYDRVSESLTMDARRLDGSHQQEYVVTNPDFYPNMPSLPIPEATIVRQAIRKLSPDIRAPYTMQTVFSVERQLPKNISFSMTFTNSRGVHMLRSRNINAPLPGSYDPLVPSSGIRLYGDTDIYLYESSGRYRQNQLIINMSSRFTRFSLSGYYVWSRARSDTDGAGSFPAEQYDTRSEYGRAGFDIRHRVTIQGTITLPRGLSLSPFIVVNSGRPFNFTSGDDYNGDSLFNDRPAWATDLDRPSVIRTSYGAFDTAPMPGQTIIPRNLGIGPTYFNVNLRVSKSFNFGGESSSATVSEHDHGPMIGGTAGAGGGDHGPGGGGYHGEMHGGDSGGSAGYSLSFSIFARNLFNTVNLAPPVGNISSPLFGTSTAIAGSSGRGGSSSANRTVELQVRFSF